MTSLATDENIFVDNEQGLTIVAITNGGASDLAGLQVGDVITKINGKSFKNAREADKILRSGEVGKEIDYTIVRDGKETVCTVKLAQQSIELRYLFLIITSIFFLGFGTTVVLTRPTYPIARLLAMGFYCFAFFLALITATASSIYNDIFQSFRFPLLGVSATFAIGILSHLNLRFPLQRFNVRYPKWLFMLLYGLPIINFFLIGASIIRNDPWISISYFALALICFSLPEFLYRKQHNPEYKEKAKFIKIGGLIFLVVMTMVILMNITLWGRFIIQYAFAFLIIFPLLYGYTIVRYRLFDIYLVIRRSVVYTLSTWLVVAMFTLSVILVINILPLWNINLPAFRFTERTIELVYLDQLPLDKRMQVEKSILISIGLLLTFLLWQAQKYSKVILEKKFYRQQYDYKKALQEFSKLSARVTEQDTLAKEVVSKVSDIMHLKGAAFALLKNGHFAIRQSVGLNQACCSTIALNPNEAWAKELLEIRSSSAIENIGAKEVFKDTGIQFLTPIVAHGRLEGLMLLGEKHAENNYTKDDVELLDSISRQVALALETMRLYEEVGEKERMKKELEIARRIQLDSLPSETPDIPGFDIAAVSHPAQEVGGDFYDFLVCHDQATFILGDVSGKGTSAALYMSRVQGIIRSLDSYQPSLWELFVRLNNQVYGHIERKSYVTVIGVRISLLNRQTSFIRAGHLPLIHYHASTHSIEIYQPRGLGVGLDERQFSATLVEQKILPERGDVILLVSDGIPESQNEQGEEYGIHNLEQVLLQRAHDTSEQIKSAILHSITRFTDNRNQRDDITCVVIKFN